MKVDRDKGRAEAAIGQCYEALGRDDEAEKRFRSALHRKDAADRQVRLAYGHFLIRHARAGEAIQILEPAQQPESAESRYLLGLALSQTDQLAEAAFKLERAVALQAVLGPRKRTAAAVRLAGSKIGFEFYNSYAHCMRHTHRPPSGPKKCYKYSDQNFGGYHEN